MKYVTYRDLREIVKDLKLIYTASTEHQGMEELLAAF